MSNAFTDVVDATDDSSSSSTESTEAVTAVSSDGTADTDGSAEETVTDISGTVFADSVRSNVPDDEELGDDPIYEDPETGKQADDVDPRALFGTASVNELRWYARHGPYGRTIIEKPIEDAFKNGFEIHGDNTEPTDGRGKIKTFLDQYTAKGVYRDAKIKARRDGLAVLQFYFDDDATTAAEPLDPTADADFAGFQVWTLDNLSGDLTDSTVAEHTPYDREQIYVSEGPEHGGVAMVDDVRDPNHGDVVGYGIKPREEAEQVETVEFVHASRCQHFTHGQHVDGDLGNNVTGKHVGESVLTPVLNAMKAAHVGFWAIKNILFRYSAPLHAIEPPETWSHDDFEQAQGNMEDISMMSDAVLPPGSELSVAEGVSEFEPEEFFDTLVNAICAGTEFTRPVLRGTQTGTVSGSETDTKNYFNYVEKLRTNEMVSDFREAVQLVARHDQETVPRVSGPETFTVEWGPLFRATDIERAEGMVSIITATTNAIKNYVLTPDEARQIVEMGWSEFEMDVDISDALTEDQMDTLDRININEAGQGIKDNEPVNEPRGTTMRQNGGGQPAGENRESSQPVRDSADVIQQLVAETDLSYEDAMDALAEE